LDYTQLRAEARDLLRGRWNTCALLMFIVSVLSGSVSLIFGLGNTQFLSSPLSILVGAPLNLGVTAIFLKLYEGHNFQIEEVFNGFRDFSRAVISGLLISVYVILWSFLLIVPGIIAALGYSMTFFILVENPQLSASQAMALSKEMMLGHKTELFMLSLSFIGWFFLSLFTFGIGIFWLAPYVDMSYTIFYHRVKAHGGVVNPGETVTGIIR